ncbi:MAG: chorismate-binding protein [Bdellovibrionales bacterium]|nr:chorismate-binding protein [Bdellovibrionales bacterium]
MLQLDKPGALLQATENTMYYATPTNEAVDGFLYHNSFWLETPQWVPVKIQEVSLQSLRETLRPEMPVTLKWQAASKDTFKSDFIKIQNKILEGNWKKAVPMTYEIANNKEGLFKHSLSHLLQSSGSGFIYAYWGTETWFLGLSPETLYEWNGSEIQTLAVAGTSHVQNKIQLLDTKKERLEHQYVVDGIKEILENEGHVDIGKTETYQVGPLEHLKTKISVKCNSLSQTPELIEKLHPTPALGSYPLTYRREPLRSILSPRPNLVFGSPFGLITKDWHKVIVAIRNLQMLDNNLYLSAGCGVVAESVLEQEWSELHSKRQAIKQRLGLL